MTDATPVLNQLNLVVRDTDASVAFYRRLGLEIDAEPGGNGIGLMSPIDSQHRSWPPQLPPSDRA
jgi:catechol 2,3-dioxygenase-like lactoylglutathione lyase family enzyme